jgi:hypothetical protein
LFFGILLFRRTTSKKKFDFFSKLSYNLITERKGGKMIKYMFNNKVQICTNKKIEFWIETNCRQKYGDNELYNNGISIGKWIIFFG